MLLGASILNIDNNRLNELYMSDIDYVHVDVMDGEFVTSTTDLFYRVKDKLASNQKNIDVHLMVKDIKKYVDEYKELSPAFIIFHYEACLNHLEIINYIKSLNIKVGLAISPGTPVDSILSFLDVIDLVLVMSVQPGKGGQEFIESTISKIKRLAFIRELNNLKFKIEVDGGINDTNVNKLENVDYVVSGSYITKSDNFSDKIVRIKSNFPLA